MSGLLRLFRQQAAAPAGDEVVRASKHVLCAERDGLTVLLDLQREIYLGLDEVGTAIWREIAEGGTPAAAAAQVAAEFDAPIETVRADTDAFILDLLRRGLVVRS
jgi:hypothetical protein